MKQLLVVLSMVITLLGCQPKMEHWRGTDSIPSAHVIPESSIQTVRFSEGVDAYKRGDYVTALEKFRLAASQGYALAQTFLGLMYAEGQGVTQDYTEALKWYRLAASQGNAVAQSNLGLMYDGGKGVTQNYTLTVRPF